MSLTIGEQHVHLWLAARDDNLASETFCRDVLSRYADLPPGQWVFEKTGEGKPRTTNAPLPLDFNLSHSGDWMVCAVSAGVPVGVDVEHTARKRDVMRLARRFYSVKEVKALEALAENEQRSSFFDLWTLKESAVKARAEALLPLLNKWLFTLEPAPEGPAKITPRFETEGPAGYYLLLDAAPDYRLALCWLGPASESPTLQMFNWQGAAAPLEAVPELRAAT